MRHVYDYAKFLERKILYPCRFPVTIGIPISFGLTSMAYAADTVRAEVGKPLSEAQRLASAGRTR